MIYLIEALVFESVKVRIGSKGFVEGVCYTDSTIEKKMKNYRLRSLFNWSLMRKPVEI